MSKINIGCGRKQLFDWINIDHNTFGQQLVLDLEVDDLPMESNSVECARADHFLEHLNDCRHILNEVWRVLEKDGTFEIYVPYGLWDRQFSPVHKQIITEHWFRWLEKNDNEEYYGYKRWNVKELTVAEKPEWGKYEIHCIMQPYGK